MQQISDELYNRLKYLGIIPDGLRPTRDHNVGQSDYSTHTIQPWSVWIDWNLDPWDADIVKRICRHKEGESPTLDYEKIIHICQEKLRQLSNKPTDKKSIVEYKCIKDLKHTEAPFTYCSFTKGKIYQAWADYPYTLIDDKGDPILFAEIPSSHFELIEVAPPIPTPDYEM